MKDPQGRAQLRSRATSVGHRFLRQCEEVLDCDREREGTFMKKVKEKNIRCLTIFIIQYFI